MPTLPDLDMPSVVIERVLITLVMGWGFALKLLCIGFRQDKANGPNKHFTLNMMWANSAKWRISGSVVLMVGLAWIGPHEGFKALSEFVIWGGIPVGHLGVASVGFLGDDIFVALNEISDRAIKKFRKKEEE